MARGPGPQARPSLGFSVFRFPTASQLMPGAELVLVPDCGHWTQLESREQFLAEVRRSLDCREIGG
jgi:pimeloyl-ACP methyl ester carboxylesterase